jgi:Domain of unknown function (DUF3883)
VLPYTYLGRLKYLTHDREREGPVYFTWQILDWNIPGAVVHRMDLHFDAGTTHRGGESSTQRIRNVLIQVAVSVGQHSRAGVPTPVYAARTQFDHGEQDARNRRLGLAGEMAVLESERQALLQSGRPDLADRLLHVAKVEGDGAGYDIRSFTIEGEEKFVEVKATRSGAETPFYVSFHEVRFAADHAERYYLYRVFEFDDTTGSGKVFIQRGDLNQFFSLTPVQFRVGLPLHNH